MRNFILGLFTLSIFVIACNPKGGNVKIYYGEKFDTTSVISTSELLDSLNKVASIKNITVSGVIDESCTHSGCWLTLQNDKGTEIMVTYKNESFTTAKDISGRPVIMKGTIAAESTKGGYHLIADGLILN